MLYVQEVGYGRIYLRISPGWSNVSNLAAQTIVENARRSGPWSFDHSSPNNLHIDCS